MLGNIFAAVAIAYTTAVIAVSKNKKTAVGFAMFVTGIFMIGKYM